jgi:adenylate cyclase
MTNDSDQIVRKLAAILSTDVKGYSRLMGDDEMATVETITRYRSFISEFVEDHHGRVVDSPGDNLLAEFASAVNALDCAVAIQEKLAVENQSLEDHRRMEFRIGINVGDVISQGERLYGDGVNIAARLEGLSDASGICISGTVYDQVNNKTVLPLGFIGARQVKNIAEPIRAYKVLLSQEMERMNGFAAQESSTFQDEAEKEQPSGSAILQLPDRPSIAVLPLVNMGQGTDQDFFSDGLTEDIITDLTKVSAYLSSPRTLHSLTRGNLFYHRRLPGIWGCVIFWREPSGVPGRGCGSPPSWSTAWLIRTSGRIDLTETSKIYSTFRTR